MLQAYPRAPGQPPEPQTPRQRAAAVEARVARAAAAAAQKGSRAGGAAAHGGALGHLPPPLSANIKAEEEKETIKESLHLPPTRTIFYFFSDSAPARWAMFKNAYLSAISALDPATASVHVIGYDDAAHALCHGLTHGDRHVLCINLEAKMPEKFEGLHADGETTWFGDKWKHFVNMVRVSGATSVSA